MDFFVLGPIVGSEAETSYEAAGEARLGEAPRCPECGLFVGQRPWLPPYSVTIHRHGPHLGDLAFSLANGTELLLSERLLSMWRQADLRGIESVEPVDVLSIEPPIGRSAQHDFFFFRAPRTQTTIDWSRSALRPERQSVVCRLCGGGGIVDAIDALSIDETSWSGEDIFVPWGVNGLVVVTRRAVERALASELRNVNATPVDAYRWNPLGRSNRSDARAKPGRGFS